MEQTNIKQKQHNLIALKVMLSIVAILGFSLTTQAQVTVGSGDAPQQFSILEVTTTKEVKGGLRMPHLTTHERDSITATDIFQAEKMGKAKGLTIFNEDELVREIQYWDGIEWVGLKGSAFKLPIKTITEDYTLTTGDYKILADGTEDLTITLPDPTTCEGRIYIIQNMNSEGKGLKFSLPVNVGLGQNMEAGALACLPIAFGGYGSFALGGTLLIQSDGTKWTGITQ
ncbi:hypothetical protein M2451_001710 [Dysgonomonas sp. PFB1-18]|uniref:hypothetical protein n=1 Tax=unclassified Dysgonomonas TaxID=2630389 RepID=UPI002476E283|nr:MULTISPECIES: hypothetical protein [unclassified Dysgonomonas]MDH6309139.1 hypothetical protein [Dysgonomonas sp. PF1-14]MDH6338981.1 hypothetical protein [Dysgonomonas sp. PF1-16]MDH6380388.1 hypothetical protein [Dysgonomonas sp. PFB1-18]MDH6397809.1 hypothetical protein [Dysgonomonas sp. PF1-23]